MLRGRQKQREGYLQSGHQKEGGRKKQIAASQGLPAWMEEDMVMVTQYYRRVAMA